MDYEGQLDPSPNKLLSIHWNRENNDKNKLTLLRELQIFHVETHKQLTEKIFIEGRSPFIYLLTDLTNRPLKMLIDTGASIGIIGEGSIADKTKIRNSKLNIYGIGGQDKGTETLGMIDTAITINGCKLNTAFHVIKGDCLNIADGILGFDFLYEYRANFDMDNGIIQFKLNDIINEENSEGAGKIPQPENASKENTPDIENSIHSLDKLYENNTADQTNAINANSSEQIRAEKQAKITKKCKKKQQSIEIIENLQNSVEIGEVDKLNESSEDSQMSNEYKEAVHYYEKCIETNNKYKAKRSVNTDMNTIECDYPNKDKTIKIPNNEAFLTPQTYENIDHFSQFEQIVLNSDLIDKDILCPTRSEEIFKKLQLKHCSEYEKTHIHEICSEYPFQFYMDGDILGHTDIIKHSIRLLPNAKTVNVRQYRIPHIHKQILQNIIENYENQGIIEKCQSAYNSPAILVSKKDENNGKTDHRFVVDYRKLNEISELYSFPIPLIDDILDGLSGCTVFTTLDIKGAFHQLFLEENSRDYTAFTAGNFQYRWIRMPMGLSAAPLTWQRAINTILADLISNGVFVYLDDVIVYANNIEKHNEVLREVMQRLKQHNLQLKISKCNFFAREFEYLGHIISHNGIKANPRKIEAINNFPIPKDMKQIQSFLGMINYYRRFIKNFAKIAKPLTSLCKKDQPYVWTNYTQEAFDKLKKILTEEITLAFPDFESIFYVTTDASDIALGAVLSQGELPNDRPLHFFSKTLSETQKHYSTIQKELLAITEAIKAFRPYLYGRFFILITDHKPLCFLFNMKDCGSRLFRQRLEILDYNFKILHRPGVQNSVADALSRMQPLTLSEMLEIENKKEQCLVTTRAQAKTDLNKTSNDTIEEKNGTILHKRSFDLVFHLIPKENDILKNKIVNRFAITNFPEKWHNFKSYNYGITISNQFSRMENQRTTNNCILEMLQICKDRKSEFIAINIDYDTFHHYFFFKNLLIRIFENSQISVTIFLNKIIQIIERDDIESILDLYHKSLLGGHFDDMANDIKEFVKNCPICEKIKVSTNTKIPMQISSLGEVLFDHTFIDFVGPISPMSSYGHKYIFTATCDLTKYMIAVPTKDCNALTTAECLLEHILMKYNFPSRIISDNASNFNSKVIHELLKMLNVRKNFTTPYHPQSNIVERGHRTLNAYLRAFTAKNKDIWHPLLKFAMFAYNNSVHTTTGYTPHELAHGFKIHIPNNLFRPKPTYNYDNLADITRKNIFDALEVAKEHLFNRKLSNKLNYDKSTKQLDIQVGDLILLKSQSKTDKFQNVYEGPFRVIEAYHDYVEILKNNRRMKVHKNLVKKSIANQNDSYPLIELTVSVMETLFEA